MSFTLGDSCAQWAIRQLTAEQLLAQMSGFPGGPEAFLREAPKPYSYIEAQLWDDTAIERGENANANLRNQKPDLHLRPGHTL